MAEIYNNRICVFANELISFNSQRAIGSDSGVISLPSYNKMKAKKQLIVLLRSTPGKSALIDFETMRPDIKQKYIEVYGDPRAQLATRSQKSVLEDAIVFSNEAFEFYTTKYRYDGKKLPPAKIDEYTLNARVIEALLSIRDGRGRYNTGGATRINVWERLSVMCNDLITLRDPHGKLLFPHTLPRNAAALKRKCEQYASARRISREDAYRTLIHKAYGNKNAALIKNEEGEAVMHKLISLHNNLNSVQIMDEYNKVAAVMGMEQIKSPVTVDNYKKKMELTTMPTRKGKKEVANTRMMQVHRSAPEQALTYWTLDGWDAELWYQKKTPKTKKDKNGEEHRYMFTSYTNRKNIVVVLDACCKYPMGYAIGDHESPALIKQALRNAENHTRFLFGKRYKPLQLQSDHYQEGIMMPFYEALAKYNTPAAVGNAKSKIIEPYFKYINVEYCQKQANWSGFGITANRDNQPNMEVLNENKKLIPDEATVIGQLEAIIARERELHIDELRAAWERTDEARKQTLSDEEYLLLMGQTTGRTNKMTGNGLRIELQGERIAYDTFDLSLREHYNEDWIVRYDPDDLSQVLISNAGRRGTKEAGKEIGIYHYMLQRAMTVPMALADQKPEHFEYRARVQQFNNDMTEHIRRTAAARDAKIEELKQRIPDQITGGLLDRYLLTDSRGQHKDVRSRQRDEAQDAEFEELIKAKNEEEEFEFDASMVNFSR